MRGGLAPPSVLFLLLAASAHAVAASGPAGDLSPVPEGFTVPVAADDGCAAAPPCGWIDPIIDIALPDKPACGGFGGLTAAERPDDCLPVPTAGEPVVLEGVFRWYWEVSEDGTYPNDPNQDVQVSFGGTAGNPDWIGFQIEPSGFVIDTAELNNPDRYRVEQGDAPNSKLWYWYEEPVSLTFTRTTDPSPDDLGWLSERNMVQNFFVKVRSTNSGERFKEAFGVEEVRFDTCADPTLCDPSPSGDGKESPGGGAALVSLALLGTALVVAARGRRD